MTRTKKILSALTALALLFGLLSCMTVYAKSSSARDFDFDRETGTITAYHGGDAVVVIPSKISGGKVRTIGERAFFQNSAVTAAVIPDGVTEIGVNAFAWCANLSDVYLPTTLESIGAQAFAGSGLTAEGVHIPTSVSHIGDQAFGSCQSLSELMIPGGVSSLNGTAAWSESLTTCVIMEGVTSMNAGCFEGCRSLEQIYLPSTLTAGGVGGEFEGCDALRSVYFGGSSVRGYSEAAGFFENVPVGCTLYFPPSVTDDNLNELRAVLLSYGLPESVTISKGSCPFYPQDYQSAPVPTDISPVAAPSQSGGNSRIDGNDNTDGGAGYSDNYDSSGDDGDVSPLMLHIGAGVIVAAILVLMWLNRKKLRAAAKARKARREAARRRAKARKDVRRAAEQRRINRLNGFEDDPDSDDPLQKYRMDLGDMDDDF